MKYLVLCVALFVYAEAANVPSYISECCATDRNAEKCFISEAKKVVPLLLSGDDKYNLMSYLPYREAQRFLLNNNDGQFILNVVRLWGLDTITIKSLGLNINKHIGICKYNFLRLKLQFTYKINIFNTALQGFGRGEIILEDVDVTQEIKFVFDSEQYAYVQDTSLKLSAANIAYNLHNLNNEAADYLENNYDHLNNLFQPGLRRILNAVLLSPFTAYTELLKFSESLRFGKDCNKS